MSSSVFSVDMYRTYNLDLRHYKDDELVAHFQAHQYEPRIYGKTRTTSEFLSMRWLRGNGLEIGAGGNPTKLFGSATSIMNDCDSNLSFGGERIDFKASLDDEDFSSGMEKRFDFAIASHVLEHADSFLRALKNLIDVTKKGGVVYLVLPDVAFLHDREWMPKFDLAHHVAEFSSPLRYARLHDDVYIKACVTGIDIHSNVHAHLTEAYKECVKAGKIPNDLRFMHHKHNYSFEGWVRLLLDAKIFLGNSFDVLDMRFGHERLDCHFVLQVAE